MALCLRNPRRLGRPHIGRRAARSAVSCLRSARRRGTRRRRRPSADSGRRPARRYSRRRRRRLDRCRTGCTSVASHRNPRQQRTWLGTCSSAGRTGARRHKRRSHYTPRSFRSPQRRPGGPRLGIVRLSHTPRSVSTTCCSGVTAARNRRLQRRFRARPRHLQNQRLIPDPQRRCLPRRPSNRRHRRRQPHGQPRPRMLPGRRNRSARYKPTRAEASRSRAARETGNQGCASSFSASDFA
jgi:hypothetical protein